MLKQRKKIGEYVTSEQFPARFKMGTLHEIKKVLENGETVADFIRRAVGSEIKKRSNNKENTN